MSFQSTSDAFQTPSVHLRKKPKLPVTGQTMAVFLFVLWLSKPVWRVSNTSSLLRVRLQALPLSRELFYSASGQKASRELCKLNKLSSGTIKKSNSQRMDKKTIKGKKKTSQGEQEEEFVLPANPPGHAGEGRWGGRWGLLALTCDNLLGN